MIFQRMDTVFIHDLEAAKSWYTDILDLPYYLMI
ncbi:hypothetical protein SAMN05421787_10284 [Virgibacillus pantothenticus]|nr:hypothetical protein SAMN05421787_10284 [Virgibacillus pantothenticus]